MTWQSGDAYNVSFGISKCRRYHAMLRDHYRRLHDTTLLLNTVAASGAFIAFLGSLTEMSVYLSAVVGLGSLFDLTCRWEEKARLHQELCQRFTQLAAKLERIEPTPGNVSRLKAKRLLIEADEPSVKRLVDLVAQNEEARSRGSSDLVPLNRLQVRLACWGSFGMGRLEKWHSNRRLR